MNGPTLHTLAFDGWDLPAPKKPIVTKDEGHRWSTCYLPHSGPFWSSAFGYFPTHAEAFVAAWAHALTHKESHEPR